MNSWTYANFVTSLWLRVSVARNRQYLATKPQSHEATQRKIKKGTVHCVRPLNNRRVNAIEGGMQTLNRLEDYLSFKRRSTRKTI